MVFLTLRNVTVPIYPHMYMNIRDKGWVGEPKGTTITYSSKDIAHTKTRTS